MGYSCSNCSNCNCGEKTENNIKRPGMITNDNINPSDSHILLINGDEKTLLEIREEIKRINNEYNIKKKKLFELDYLSQYYINQKKDKLDNSISNQILMTYTNNINPFEENLDNNEDIIEVKKKIKNIEKKYQNKILIKSMSPSLNLTQTIENNYNFTFELENVITKKFDKFVFNDLEVSLIIIHFNIRSDIIIKKINEIKAFERELKFKLIY